MRILEQWTAEFSRDPVCTEQQTWQLLSARPLRSEVTYLAVPWAVLINEGRLHDFQSVDASGGFSVCQHIEFERILPILKDCGVEVLFTPHAERRQYLIEVLPYPHVAVNSVAPIAKHWLYSFVGFDSHPVRRKLLSLPDFEDVVVIERSEWHFGSKRREQERREYQSLLAASRFSLCPRGSGPGTIRFWESLQAGAIPVVIADSLRLPDGWDWEQTALFVEESEAETVDAVIRGVAVRDEELLRANCLQAYEQFSVANLVSPIHKRFDNQR